MLFCCCLQPEGRAEDGYMESINGADQEFTYGYAQAERVRTFEQGIQERQEAESGTVTPTAEEAEGKPWRLRKGFRVSTLYDSNLFYSRTDTKDDVLFIYTPFAGVSLGKKNISRLYLNAFYELSYVDYVEVQKFSRFNQALTFEARLHEEKYDLSFKNTFKPASARETGERAELASANNNRVIAWTDNAQIEGVYHLRPKVDLTAAYDYAYVLFPASSNQNNPEVELFSYQKNTFTPGIAYKYSRKTTFFLKGSAGYTDYFRGGEFSSRNYRAAAGVLNRLTPKTDLTFEAAYARTDYLAERFQPSEGPQFGAIVRYQFTPKIAGTFSVNHSIGEAFDFRSFSTELVDSLKSESTIFRIDASWRVNEPLVVTAFTSVLTESREGFYTLTDPENPTLTHTRQLEDQVYSYGLSFRWDTKGSWTYFGSVESLTKFSSFKNMQYDEQRIAGSLRMDF